MSEFAYIDWLRRQTPVDPRVLIGPGDDTAALKLSPGVPCLVIVVFVILLTMVLLYEVMKNAS